MKYPLLYDKAWLEQKYLEEGLSSRAISELIGCGTTSVENGLKRFKISARNGVVAHTKYPQLLDTSWLENAYLEEELSSTEIGKIVGCDCSTVTRALKRSNISTRTAVGSRRKHIKGDDKCLIEHLYINERMRTQEIGKLVGCSATTIYNVLKHLDIPIRSSKEAHLKLLKVTNELKLKSLYIKERKTRQEIANIFDCSSQGVLSILKWFGVPIRSYLEANKRDSEYSDLNSKEWLNQKYWQESLSSPKIAETLGCTPSTVIRHLVKQGVPRRTPSENRRMWTVRCNRTKIEVILESILIKYVDNLEYIGDNAFWIKTSNGNLNPDFIIREKRIAIEANGMYWHSPLLNHNLRRNAIVTYRKEYLKAVGWRLVVFWETDILRKDAEQFILHVLRREGIV